MDDGVWLLAVLVGIIPVSVGLIFLVTWLSSKRGRVAQTLVEAGSSFELQCAPADARQYSLWARYGVQWPEGGSRAFGLIFDLKVQLDGRVIYEGKLGIGRNTPGASVKTGSTEYMVVSSGGRGYSGGSHKATTLLLDLGPRVANSSILVTGTLAAAPNTTARPTKIYIGR